MAHRSRFALAAVLAALLVTVPTRGQEEAPPAAAPQAGEPQFQNLQVLPQDITRPELIELMKGFTRGLGVRCQHCHIGEEGMPLDEFDFASDGKETKKKARVMLEMVEEINTSFLPRLGEGARVSCLTCHHGNLHPETLEDALWAMYERGGAEAALARYGQLREQHYGGWTYDFSERSLLRFGRQVAEAGDGDGARAVVERNLEHFPESALSWFTLGELKLAEGDFDGATAAYQRTLEAEPRFAPAQRRLMEMEAAKAAVTAP